MAKQDGDSNGGGVPGGPPLSAHPLVLGVAGRMFGAMNVVEAHSAAKDALDDRYISTSWLTALQLTPGASGRNPDFVDNFVADRGRPELVLMAGYLADRVPDPDPSASPWQVMFSDETLEMYLLVRSDDIQFHDRVDDTNAAFGVRDVLWVRADAPLLRGERTESVVSRIANGAFTSARDFRASMSGGTLQGASDLGPLCTELTPCCCRRLSP
jgi:hypothetical protein